MSYEISVVDGELAIDLSGVHKMLCLAGRIAVPLRDITAVRAATQSEAKGDMGWRVGGGYFPGWFATGWYTFPGRKGARQWWCAFRDAAVVVIDTDLDRPCRIVVQDPEPDRVVAMIESARSRVGTAG